MRSALVGIATGIVALVVVATVFAGDPTKEKIARTRAGNAAAARLVAKKRDLPLGWSGGSIKPSLSSSLGCASYKPKQSDLVLIGAAQTHWTRGPSSLDSEAQVLRRPKMVKLDWKRTVADPRVLPCVRQATKRHLPPSDKLISLDWIHVPALARYSKAYRVVVAVRTGSATENVVIDALTFGAGRDEVTLIGSTLTTGEKSIHKLELRLARRLAKRLHG